MPVLCPECNRPIFDGDCIVGGRVPQDKDLGLQLRSTHQRCAVERVAGELGIDIYNKRGGIDIKRYQEVIEMIKASGYELTQRGTSADTVIV